MDTKTKTGLAIVVASILIAFLAKSGHIDYDVVRNALVSLEEVLGS